MRLHCRREEFLARSISDDPEIVASLNAIWHQTSRATVLLYGFQGGAVVHGGSGVLLRVGDAYFILTAAHVARAAFHNVPLFISSAGLSRTALTWSGHEFLDAARDEGRWTEAKRLTNEKAGSITMAALTQILTHLMTQALGM